MRRYRPVGLVALLLSLLLALLPASLFAQSQVFGDDDDPPSAPVVRTYEVRITANVRGASVYLDGRYQGRTPQTLRLREGTYEFEVEARGYERFRQQVTIRADRTINAQLLPPTAVVLLRIPSEFLNSDERDPWRLIDFFVDGRLRREARVELEPGWHRVAIVSGGLRLEQEFFFEAGRIYTMELFMRADISTRSEF